MNWPQLAGELAVLFALTMFLTVIVKLSILNGARPKVPERLHPDRVTGPAVAARLAIVRDLAPGPFGGEGYLGNVLEVSKDEPAVVSGYGDGERRRLTVRTFPQGTYYLVERPATSATVEIFIANDGGRVPVTGGMIVGGTE